MYTYQCPQCGRQFTTQTPVQNVQCPYCQYTFAPAYGQPQAQQQPAGYRQPMGVFDEGPSGKSRGVAALLCFLLGGFGAHYFYVGKTTGALICILLCIITCGVWGLMLIVQTIMLVTMSQEDFERKWVYSTSSFPLL